MNDARHVRESIRNPVGVVVARGYQPNVVLQSRDNGGLWDGAPLGLNGVWTFCGLKARHVTAWGEAHQAKPQVKIPNGITHEGH